MPRRIAKPGRARVTGVAPIPVSAGSRGPYSSGPADHLSSIAHGEGQDSNDSAVDSIPMGSLSLGDPSDLSLSSDKPKRKPKPKPFRFMDLPSELRVKIYDFHFEDYGVIDLDQANHKTIWRKLHLLRTSRTVYHEASYFFYSTRTFRIFPTSPGRFFKTKKPLLARLKPHQRACITSLELRLGPGWNRPPRGWVVNDALGLAECCNTRRLSVFVECDPSDNIFNGFRKAEGFYEQFSRNLLRDVLGEMPFVDRIEFDAWSSVRKNGDMMTGLFKVARETKRGICWGKARGWTNEDEVEEELLDQGSILIPDMAAALTSNVAVIA